MKRLRTKADQVRAEYVPKIIAAWQKAVLHSKQAQKEIRADLTTNRIGGGLIKQKRDQHDRMI